MSVAFPVRAVDIPGYTTATNARFASGFPNSPVLNTSASFIGAGEDFSAVGWLAGSGVNGRMHTFTMLSPLHWVSAQHYYMEAGQAARLVGTDGQLVSATLKSTTFSPVPMTGLSQSDIRLGRINDTLEAAQKVNPVRLLDVTTRDYKSMTLHITGSQADGAGLRVGLGTHNGILLYSSTTQWALIDWVYPIGTGADATGYARYWDSGDSGSPMFIAYTSPDGTKQATYAGHAWYSDGANPMLPGTAVSGSTSVAFDPTTGVNNELKKEGYALRWTIYDNPADTARTASRWSGAAGTGDLATAGNWSAAAAPSGVPVLFDASAAGGQTALTASADRVLRGLLFKASAASGGFTFTGAGKLTFGLTGLRNEAAGTQTFNNAIVLGGSQNWEAVGGPLVFNGTIDTGSGSHLVVVGGPQDTTFNGIVSNSGALAKDDAGTLTLNAANTYTGLTFVHNGTLNLGATGSLPSTAQVVFQTTNPAVFDLNGRNQTLADLRSSSGGAGAVNLGAAKLTVNTALSNTFAGVISGAGSIAKSGAGTWTLAGANAHTGGISLDAGALSVSSAANLGGATAGIAFNGGTLQVTGTALASLATNTVNWTTFNGGIDLADPANVFTFSQSLAGVGSLTKLGPGTLALNAANAHTGGTTIGAGTLRVGHPSALGGSSAVLTIKGGTLDLNNFNPTIGRLAGTGGVITSNAATTTPATLTVAGSAASSFSGVIQDGVQQPLAIANTGTGTLSLSGANTHGGGTTVNTGGTLRAGNTSAFGLGTVTLAGGTLQLAAGALAGFDGFALNGSASLANDVLTLTDNTSNKTGSAFSGYKLTLANAAGFSANFIYTPSGNRAADGFTFTIQNATAGSTALGGGGGGIGYTGIGNSGAIAFNLYTGGGELAGTTYAASGALVKTGLSGKTYQTVSPVGLNSGRPISVNLTYDGVAKTLTETLVDGANTSTVSYANVDFEALLGGTVGYVGFTGASGGSTATQKISGFAFDSKLPAQAYANAVALTADSVINVLGAPAALGAVSLGGCKLSLTGANARLTLGAVTLGGDAIVDTANGTTLILGAVGETGGARGFTKTGPGKLLLAGANASYGGATNLLAGTVQLAASNAIGDVSPVTLGGVVLAPAGRAETAGALTVSAASTIDFAGGGALVFADSHTRAWNAGLALVNFDPATCVLRVGTTSGGLSSAQLANITLNGGVAAITPDGYVSTPDAAWRWTYFGTFALSAGAADNADPDGDGAPNLLERALGMNPSMADTDLLPSLAASGDHLTLTFNRAANTTDLTFRVEASSDLASTAWIEIHSTPGVTTADQVTVTDPQVLGTTPRRFLRLKITRT